MMMCAPSTARQPAPLLMECVPKGQEPPSSIEHKGLPGVEGLEIQKDIHIYTHISMC